jgi:hypothetical protein
MAVVKNKPSESRIPTLSNEGIKLAFDKEVIEILLERESIKNTEAQPPPEEKSVSDMYSDISDDGLPFIPTSNPKVDEEIETNEVYGGKISDLVKKIEEKREREINEKKKRDITPATVEDYFK